MHTKYNGNKWISGETSSVTVALELFKNFISNAPAGISVRAPKGQLVAILLLSLVVANCATDSTRHANRLNVPRETPLGNEPQQNQFKVVVLILENEDQVAVTRNSDLVFLQKMKNEGALLLNYSAVAHPSQPNYVALVSGSTNDVKDDGLVSLDRDYIGKFGPSWAAYAEDYPTNGCPLDRQIGKYVRKHVPFLSFKDIQEDPVKRCAHVLNIAAFFDSARGRKLPDLSFLIPNLDNDGHNKPLKFADEWLVREILPVIEDPWFRQNVVLVVTFDEDGSRFPYLRMSNHVYTAFWGNHILHTTRSEPYNHYSLLKTLEAVFNVEPMMKNDRDANVIRGIWK
jgi:hypothetical protein